MDIQVASTALKRLFVDNGFVRNGSCFIKCEPDTIVSLVIHYELQKTRMMVRFGVTLKSLLKSNAKVTCTRAFEADYWHLSGVLMYFDDDLHVWKVPVFCVKSVQEVTPIHTGNTQHERYVAVDSYIDCVSRRCISSLKRYSTSDSLRSEYYGERLSQFAFTKQFTEYLNLK
jgi:hypothetical protein